MKQDHRTKRKPTEIDIYVGERIRLARALYNVTQDKLGERIGLTFQMVQKFEKGKNRVSCGKIAEIARIFDLPITWFFPPEFGTEGAMKIRKLESVTFDLNEHLKNIEKIAREGQTS